MGSPEDDLDEYAESLVYDDGTIVRVSIRRTDDAA